MNRFGVYKWVTEWYTTNLDTKRTFLIVQAYRVGINNRQILVMSYFRPLWDIYCNKTIGTNIQVSFIQNASGQKCFRSWDIYIDITG